MKYIKVSLLFLIISITFNAKADLSSNLHSLKRELLGVSLVSPNDPRVIAVVVASSLSVLCGLALTYKAFSDEKKDEQKSFLKRILAFISGNILISNGFAAILFARSMVTIFDELSHKALQTMPKQ